MSFMSYSLYFMTKKASGGYYSIKQPYGNIVKASNLIEYSARRIRCYCCISYYSVEITTLAKLLRIDTFPKAHLLRNSRSDCTDVLEKFGKLSR